MAEGPWVVAYYPKDSNLTPDTVVAPSWEAAVEDVWVTVLQDLRYRISGPVSAEERARLEALQLELFLEKDHERAWALIKDYLKDRRVFWLVGISKGLEPRSLSQPYTTRFDDPEEAPSD